MSTDVLLNERDPESRRRTAKILRMDKLKVVMPEKDLLASVQTHRPQLILTDLTMPGMSGLDVVRQIRKAAPDVAIVVLTSQAHGGKELARALKEGATDFLKKPFDPVELRFRIMRCLGGVKPTLDLYDPGNGRLDAVRLADFLGISLRRLAKTIGKPYKTIHRSPSTLALQEDLAPIAACISVLSRYFASPEEIRAWFNTPHPELDRRTAMSLLDSGQIGVVRDMLEAAGAGIPT